MTTDPTTQTPLDLTDTQVQTMADRNHRPEELWNLGGNLVSCHCRTCGHQWPCPTRRALNETLRDR